eukprot:scpid107126/ scgid18011/ 
MVAPFRLLCTNAFGLSSKLGDFQHALLQHNPDVAVVTETKFTTEKVQVSDTIFPGYSPPFRLDRTAHGGGVAIWVRSTLPALIIDELAALQHEVLYPYPSSLGPGTRLSWEVSTGRVLAGPVTSHLSIISTTLFL